MPLLFGGLADLSMLVAYVRAMHGVSLLVLQCLR